MVRKQLRAAQNREDAPIEKQIETAYKEMARLKKYVNVSADYIPDFQEGKEHSKDTCAWYPEFFKLRYLTVTKMTSSVYQRHVLLNCSDILDFWTYLMLLNITVHNGNFLPWFGSVGRIKLSHSFEINRNCQIKC